MEVPTVGLAYSFFRPPHWRWARATWLVEHHQQPDQRFDDAWVIRAVGYLTNACASGSTNPIDSTLSEAIALYQNRSEGAIHILEALLLTPASDESISFRLAHSPLTVEAYEQLFFAVRGAARDWIVSQVIGWPLQKLATSDRLLKYIAFSGGAPALDLAIAVMTSRPLPDWTHKLIQGDPTAEARLRLKCKLSLALLAADSTEQVQSLAEINERLNQTDRFASRRRKNTAATTPTWMTAILNGLPARKRQKRKVSKEVIPSAPAINDTIRKQSGAAVKDHKPRFAQEEQQCQ